MQNNKKYLVVVCGATAVGKTALAIQLANEYNTEIVSADSRQFFAEISIGTAKPSKEEMALAKHHFIGHISIETNFNAGRYEVEGLEKLNQLFLRYNVIVLVGGSGLYINALCNGMDEIPEIMSDIRSHLNKKFKLEGIEPLLQQLKRLDEVYYNEVDQSNHIRIIRALEVCLSTGKPFSSYRKKTRKERDFEVIKIGLNLKREVLYNRINERVDAMLAAGLVAEVQSLIPQKHLNALHTVGYSELFDYFDGQISFEIAVELIKQHTRNFAKRQLTWFNKDADIQWFEPNDYTSIAEYLALKIKP